VKFLWNNHQSQVHKVSTTIPRDYHMAIFMGKCNEVMTGVTIGKIFNFDNVWKSTYQSNIVLEVYLIYNLQLIDTQARFILLPKLYFFIINLQRKV